MSVWSRRIKSRIGFQFRKRKPGRVRRNTKKKSGKFWILLLIGTLLCYLFYIYFLQFRPILYTMAEAQANSLALQAVNQSVADVMKDTSYEDMVSLMKGDGEKVTAVVSNIVAINRLKSELAINIDKSIQNIDHFSVMIPIGSIIGVDFLSGMGPRMQIGIISDGVTKVDFINHFDAAGINQTRHQIQLYVDTTVNLIIPNSIPITATVSTQIPVAETVIVGDVPNLYANIGAAGSSVREDIMGLD